MTDAREIYQLNLDIVSRAVWTKDCATVLQHLKLPNQMYTADAGMLVRTAEELCAVVEDFRAYLQRMGALDYHRICTEAEVDPDNPDRITGKHRTYILRGGRYVIEPYVNDMVMERVDGHWMATELRAHVENKTCTVVSPRFMRGRDRTS